MGKDNYIYLKDDAALEEFQAANKGKKYTVNRFKGLGEMDQDETEILVNEEQRTLCRITVEDIEKANILFDNLMGTAVTPRKKYIQEHSAEATYGI